MVAIWWARHTTSQGFPEQQAPATTKGEGDGVRQQQEPLETVWSRMFIYCKVNINSHRLKKGEGRRASPNSLPTQPQHCNWLEGVSISLELPIMSQVTENNSRWQVWCRSCSTHRLVGLLWVTELWLFRIAYQGNPSQLFQGQRREIGDADHCFCLYSQWSSQFELLDLRRDLWFSKYKQQS